MISISAEVFGPISFARRLMRSGVQSAIAPVARRHVLAHRRVLAVG